MIRVHGTEQIADMRQYLIGLPVWLNTEIDRAIQAELDALIQDRLVPNTPVRTGDMQRGYRATQLGPGQWELTDEMFYSRFVIDGTRYMRANPALNRELDAEEQHLEFALTAVVARVTKGGRP